MSTDTPRDGDLVISRRKDDGRFEIAVSPGRPQMALKYKNEAVTHAFAYAERNGGAVWFLEASGRVTRVERGRSHES